MVLAKDRASLYTRRGGGKGFFMFGDLTENDRLRELVVDLAEAVDLGTELMQALDIAASLLGVGRLPVIDILEKKGVPSTEEIARLRDIPSIWADFADQIAILRDLGVPEIIEAYCEHWDGTGNPNGLSGEAIPLGARILAVCYHYNGMISDRPYREALPRDRAAAEIRRMSGKMLDPDVVKVFLAITEERVEGAREAESTVGSASLAGPRGTEAAADQKPAAEEKPEKKPEKKPKKRAAKKKVTRKKAAKEKESKKGAKKGAKKKANKRAKRKST